MVFPEGHDFPQFPADSDLDHMERKRRVASYLGMSLEEYEERRLRNLGDLYGLSVEQMRQREAEAVHARRNDASGWRQTIASSARLTYKTCVMPARKADAAG